MIELFEIEKRVKNLSKEDLISFRNWFYEYDNQVWDKQFEGDAKSGKLDDLASAALKEYEKGDFSDL